jgi:hypothetical protein
MGKGPLLFLRADPPNWQILLDNYEQICSRTSQQILASGRVQKYFYLSLGMSRSTFERRLRSNDWRPQELRRLMELLGK